MERVTGQEFIQRLKSTWVHIDLGSPNVERNQRVITFLDELRPLVDRGSSVNSEQQEALAGTIELLAKTHHAQHSIDRARDVLLVASVLNAYRG